jgi:hypothetical protein
VQIYDDDFVATLREIYEGIHPEGNFGGDITFETVTGPVVVHGRCHFSYDTNARYSSYFVSARDDWWTPLLVLVNQPEAACAIADRSVDFTQGNPSLGVPMRSSKSLAFAGKVYLYVEAEAEDVQRHELFALGEARGLSIEIRDLHWLSSYNANSKPMAFLCHDSRDKDDVARPLVHLLGGLLCPVWYDEYSLSVGDSLTESISRGILEAKKCIVILSPNFISNPGWTKSEFAAIMGRHIEDGGVLLPVWHKVTKAQVRDYSAFLTDIFAANTLHGMDSVARKLAKAVRK